MFNQENDFYVCLLSNNSMNYYNGNTLSSFTNLLSSPCNFDGRWKVGLTEIAFNSYTIPNKTIEAENKRTKRFAKAAPLKPPIPMDNIENPQTSSKHSQTNDSGFTSIMFIPKPLSQLPDPTSDKINVTQNSNEQTKISIAKRNKEKQNIENTKPSQEVGISVDQLFFPEEYHPIPNITPQLTYPILNYMYIYSEIIKPRYVGDVRSRYLKVLPKLDSRADIIKIDNIEYCPVEKSYIENISILICDDQGIQINFKSGTSPTYIMLHFIKS